MCDILFKNISVSTCFLKLGGKISNYEIHLNQTFFLSWVVTNQKKIRIPKHFPLCELPSLNFLLKLTKCKRKINNYPTD